MLTLRWSDGVSCMPLDFSPLSSSDADKQLCGSQKLLDKSCCAIQRRKEATIKATAHLEFMIQRTLSTDIRGRYPLMGSWFVMPATVMAPFRHIDLIGMVKKRRRFFKLTMANAWN